VGRNFTHPATEYETKDQQGQFFNEHPTPKTIIEPHHDKTNIMGLRPAWIQTSLRIRAV
jgi:hypothetical protein